MALRFDAQGWLVPGSDPNIRVDTSIRTGKTYSEFSTLFKKKPVGMVWHWTGGGYGSATAPSSYLLEVVVDRARKASWHFYIAKDGTLFQHASIYTPTWHVGMPGQVYDPLKGDFGALVPVRDVNYALLGVEMANAGVLKQGKRLVTDPKTKKTSEVLEWYAWPYGAETSTCSNLAACSETQALKAIEKGVQFLTKYRVDSSRAVPWENGMTYDVYPKRQVDTATALAQALTDALGWSSPKQIHYSHEQFAPKSKLDPGPVWMEGALPQIEARVFGRSADGRGASIGVGTVAAALMVVGAAYYLWRSTSGSMA